MGKWIFVGLSEGEGQPKIHPQMAEEAAPLGDGHPKVPGSSFFGFYDGPITHLYKMTERMRSKEISEMMLHH